MSKRSFFYVENRIYIHLPSIITYLSDRKHFKTDVKRWIIPCIVWRNTLIKTCHDLRSFYIVINMKLAKL